MHLALIHNKTGEILHQQATGELLTQLKNRMEGKLGVLNQRGHVLELLDQAFNEIVDEYKASESPKV